MDYFVRRDTKTRLAYEWKASRHPDAETIVFIHGLSFNRHIWEAILTGMQENYSLLIYDLCGHGDSDSVDCPLTWDFFCSGLIQLLDHLKIDSSHIVGHGFGGIIGLHAALHYTKRIRTMALVSTPLYFPEDFFAYEYDSRIDLLENDYEGFVEKLVKAELNHPMGYKRIRIETAIRSVDADTYREGVSLVFNSTRSLIEDLPKIEVPTLLMSGDRNPVFPPHLTAFYASVIPMSRVQIIPNASNAVFIDRPLLFIEALQDFLGNEPSVSYTPGYRFLMKKIRTVLENAYKSELTAPVLGIHTLGKFSCTWRGLPLNGKWTQRSAKELLLYLSLRKCVSRDRLIEAFFTEAEANKAKNYLRVMLNHLKTIFEATGDPELIDALQVSRGTVSLRCHINSDLSIFLDILKKGFHEDRDIREMKLDFLHLLDHFSGGLFVGFRAPWIAELREQIENKLSNTLMKLVSWCESRRLFDEALSLLSEGRSIELYDGYCQEKMDEIIAQKEAAATSRDKK